MNKICSFIIALLILQFTFSHTFAQQTPTLTLLKQYATNHQKQLAVSAKDIDALFVTSQYTDATTGIQHIYSVQKLNGFTITGSSFSLHIAGAMQTHANRLLALAKYRILPANT